MSSEIALEARPLAADLLEDLLAFARISDHAGSDQQEELGALDAVDRGAEQEADDRDLREPGDALLLAGPPGPDEPAQHQRLVVAQDDRRLRLPLDDVGREARRTRIADVVDGLMRGVTVRMMPASRYSTLCVRTCEGTCCCCTTWPTPVDAETCCCVTIGTEFDTLMTAFLFSEVMIVGLDSTVSWP